MVWQDRSRKFHSFEQVVEDHHAVRNKGKVQEEELDSCRAGGTRVENRHRCRGFPQRELSTVTKSLCTFPDLFLLELILGDFALVENHY